MAHETTRSHSAWDENTKSLLNSRASLAFGTAGTGAAPWRQFALRLSRSLKHPNSQNLEKFSALCFQSCLTLVWCRNTPRRQVTRRQHLLGLPFIPLLQFCLRKAFPTSERSCKQVDVCALQTRVSWISWTPLRAVQRLCIRNLYQVAKSHKAGGKSLARKTARMTPSASIHRLQFSCESSLTFFDLDSRPHSQQLVNHPRVCSCFVGPDPPESTYG